MLFDLKNCLIVIVFIIKYILFFQIVFYYLNMNTHNFEMISAFQRIHLQFSIDNLITTPKFIIFFPCLYLLFINTNISCCMHILTVFNFIKLANGLLLISTFLRFNIDFIEIYYLSFLFTSFCFFFSNYFCS